MKGRKLQYEYTPLFFLIFFLGLSFICKVDYREKESLYERGMNEEREYKNSFYSFVHKIGFQSDKKEVKETDLERIRKRGKLVALTGYGPTSYFIYKGTPMGFEYDLLKLLAKDLKVELEIVVMQDANKIFEMLNKGEVDIIADNLTITKERDALVDFTIPLANSKQVLIQRKSRRKNESVQGANPEKFLIRSPVELLGKEVHVRKGSAYYSRLKNLSEELGGDIKIAEVSGDIDTEQLVAMVSEGKISYTICDENSANIHSQLYPNIDISTPVSLEQRMAWAVREDCPLFLKRVNSWLGSIKKAGKFQSIYNKYYLERATSYQLVRCTRDSTCDKKISPYDHLIIEHAQNIGWDWRLLAALIYQESQFNPKAKSWAGACGLMQLMPGTAECFGAVDPEDPEQSLRAGTKYLEWLEKYWKNKVPDKNERLKFIIASYNVGQEHVADAQRLTVKYNKDPHVWNDNVAFYLLQKSKEEYCKDPVVKYGYCRGSEPFAYVNNILERYEHYKKLIREIV